MAVGSVKTSAGNDQDYFVKLTDDLSEMVPDLLFNLMEAMKEMRRLAAVFNESNPVAGDYKRMGPNDIYIRQFDVTHDMAGLVYSKDV